MLIKKIVIVGTSGSGKTTLGREIALRLNLPQIDLDDHFWLPNWTPRNSDEFQQIIVDKFNDEQWIITGNYSRLSKDMWPKADMVIWLDLPLPVLLWRGLKRSLNHIFYDKPTCNGNKETYSRLFGRNSILLWILKGYKRRKRTCSLYFERQKNSGQTLVHLKNSKEIQLFLTTLVDTADQICSS